MADVVNDVMDLLALRASSLGPPGLSLVGRALSFDYIGYG